MGVPVRARPALTKFWLLIGLAMTATPASVTAAPRARLVHCGDETCLRLSGHRSHSAVIVRIAGHDLAVEGDHAWRTTVPLGTARNWADRSGDTMMLTLADTQAGTERVDLVALPPGALGKRVELATLVVHAH
jgi:hypothetical protein